MNKNNALFICVHNSARSQMAEAYVRLLSNGEIDVESAGFEPTEINPLVIEVMKEEGIDLANKKTQSVFDLFKQGKTYRFVVTVCGDSRGGQCPIFPGVTHRLHLPFPDPAALTGTDEEQLEKIRDIRDGIKKLMQDFVSWVKDGSSGALDKTWHRIDIEKNKN